MSGITRKEAWDKLCAAATRAGVGIDLQVNKALHDAALEWAAFNGYAKAGETRGAGGRVLRSGEVIPFGRSKGLPVEEAEDKDLHFVLERVRAGLDDPDKARWRDKNQKLVDAIERELETR